jgi:hypothetical protein
MAMSTKAATTIFVAILTSLSALTACGEQGNTDAARATADAEKTTSEPGPVQEERAIVARAGGAKARIGDGVVARAGGSKARAGDRAVAKAEGGKTRINVHENAPGRDAEDRSQGITLKIGGTPGTKFSGICSVGGEEKTLGGRVPARYVYESDAEELECEIRKRSVGALEVVLAAGKNVRSVQRTSAPGGTITFAYSGSSISSSTFSSG